MRHRGVAVVGTVAACALLLSGCFGSGGGQEPTAAHHTRHHRSPSSPTTETTATAPTTPPTTPPVVSTVLRFSPKSDQKHSRQCLALHPGDDPAEFVYYPVLVKTTAPVTVASISTAHSAGVTVAGSWVSPAPATPGTGVLPGWPPPKIFTQSNSIQWSKKVTAAGATFDPTAGWYNVILEIQVDPSPGDSTMDGVVFNYHDSTGDHSVTWGDHITFSMSCPSPTA